MTPNHWAAVAPTASTHPLQSITQPSPVWAGQAHLLLWIADGGVLLA